MLQHFEIVLIKTSIIYLNDSFISDFLTLIGRNYSSGSDQYFNCQKLSLAPSILCFRPELTL